MATHHISERDAEAYLQATVSAMTRIITHTLSSKKVSEEISFVCETLASYLLEVGADDFDLDLETLLQDAGLRDAIEDDDEFDSLICSLDAMMDPSKLGAEFEELPDYSTCDMCDRHMKLTFHHLIPKELHRKYIKKNRLPGNLTAAEPGLKMAPFLGNFGVYVCRPCHSAIHRCEPNRALAEEYNTLDRLLAHAKIGAWATFNSKQKIREK